MAFLYRLIGRLFNLKPIRREELGDLALSMDNFIKFQSLLKSGMGKAGNADFSDALVDLVAVATGVSRARIMRTSLKMLIEIYGDIIRANNVMVISKKKMDEIRQDMDEAMKSGPAASTASGGNTPDSPAGK